MLDLAGSTIIFQIINFCVLLLILNFLVFRPLRRRMDERGKAISDALQNARDQEAEATQLRDEWRVRMDTIAQEREDLLLEAQQEANAKTSDLLRSTRERIDVLTAQMRRDVTRQRNEVVSQSYDEIVDSVIDLSGNVVQSVTTRRAHDDLITNFMAQLYQTGQDEVEGYRRAMAGRTPTAFVTTPTPLSADQVRNLTDTLSSVVDRRMEIKVTVDPSLIAGIQVRLADRLLDNSIRSQLGRVRSTVYQELLRRYEPED